MSRGIERVPQLIQVACLASCARFPQVIVYVEVSHVPTEQGQGEKGDRLVHGTQAEHRGGGA